MLVPSSAVLSVDIQLVSVDFHEIQFFGAHIIFFVYVGTVHILIDFMIYFWLVNIKKMTGYIYRTFTISRFEHSRAQQENTAENNFLYARELIVYIHRRQQH